MRPSFGQLCIGGHLTCGSAEPHFIYLHRSRATTERREESEAALKKLKREDCSGVNEHPRPANQNAGRRFHPIPARQCSSRGGADTPRVGGLPRLRRSPAVTPVGPAGAGRGRGRRGEVGEVDQAERWRALVWAPQELD